jgi:hypothetical protein
MYSERVLHMEPFYSEMFWVSTLASYKVGAVYIKFAQRSLN